MVGSGGTRSASIRPESGSRICSAEDIAKDVERKHFPEIETKGVDLKHHAEVDTSITYQSELTDLFPVPWEQNENC
jgi:hypothetical protein